MSTSLDASGSFETPHPYDNSAMYMFEVTLSESDIAAGKQLHWSFDEFEGFEHSMTHIMSHSQTMTKSLI